MQVRKYRWSKHYESAEEELVELLAAKGITANRWSATESEILTPQATAHDSHIWCAEGSLVITTGGQRYSMQPGDVLDLPASSQYEVRVGLTGCVCYQSPAPANLV